MNRMGRYDNEDAFSWKPDRISYDPAISTEDLICCFGEFLKQHKDIQIVKAVAFEADLVPENFYSDSHIELGFDLCFLDERVCQIYKTWNDPGFRFVREILLDKEASLLKSKFIKIGILCNVNFVRHETRHDTEGRVVLELEIMIFYDGLNGKVLRSAVEALEFIDTKVKEIIEERQG